MKDVGYQGGLEDVIAVGPSFGRTGLRLLAAVLAITLLTSLELLLSPAASAACDFTLPNQSGAHTSSQTTIYGASSQISFHNPTVCNQTGRYSEAWSMVSAPNDGSPNGTHWWYMQVGYKDRENNGPVEWATWTKSCYPNGCNGIPTHASWYGDSVSGQNFYAVYLVASTQRLRGTIDGTAIGDGPTYNPADYWDAHWSADFSAETADCDSDIVGVPTDKVHFDHVKRYNGDGTITFISNFADEGVTTACHSGYNYDAFTPTTGGIGFKTWTG